MGCPILAVADGEVPSAPTQGGAEHRWPDRENRLDFVANGEGQDLRVSSCQVLSDVVAMFDADQTAIGVLVVDDNQFVTIISKGSLAHFLARPYTQFLFLRRPIRHMLDARGETAALCFDGREAIADVIDHALARPAAQRYEPVVCRSADGTLRLVDVHSMLLVQNRQLRLTIASLDQQRTARAAAERAREALSVQLLEASRDAGRAEVATGILHNVGNVLNSVTTSRAMISRTLERSKVPNLLRAVAMLGAHRADLATFFETDRRGRALPGYLEQVAEILGAEHEAMRQEVAELGDKLDHIHQVIATQQAHARARAVIHAVRPSELIDDAARLNSLSIERHKINVVRDYGDLAPVPLDRHRVVQILVNLVSNAKNAVKAGRTSGREITLSVRQTADHGPGSVQFKVTDNGVGIDASQLTKIFSHGFTTRRDGHGFGLHTSANDAREMGGTLRVESGGVGLGAQFTLTLPPHREASPEPAP